LFLNNRYTKIYFQLIEDRKNKPEPSGYCEKHHIIPRSMGGSNSKENIVKLVLRDHLFAHRLLIRMTSGRNKSKMTLALFLMMSGKQSSLFRIPETVRSRFVRDYADFMRKRVVSEETKEKMRRYWRGRPKSKEWVEKINKNPIKIEKTANKHRGMKRSEKAKSKMRASAVLRLQRQGGIYNKGLIGIRNIETGKITYVPVFSNLPVGFVYTANARKKIDVLGV